MTAFNRKIRVLVVDDSSLVRDLLKEILSSAPDIEVIGEAANGLEAIEKVIALQPDIVTMDIEMPVMGGMEAIERIMAQNPLPILVVTAMTGIRTAFTAVSKGALDLIEKPDVCLENMKLLISKIRLLAQVDIREHRGMARQHQQKIVTKAAGHSSPQAVGKIVAMAASVGGPQAISSILAALPASFPVPIIITQHITEGFTQGMVEWLNSGTPLTVKIVQDGAVLAPGLVYVNPAEHTLRISEQGVFQLGERDRSRPYNPSCDTMLVSVATAFHKHAIGLILSGMGHDGLVGMQAIRAHGGASLAQDEASSMIYGMNQVAINHGCIDQVLPLAAIPAELLRRVSEPLPLESSPAATNLCRTAAAWTP